MATERDTSFYDLIGNYHRDLIGIRISKPLPYQVEGLLDFYHETTGSNIPESINNLYHFENYEWTRLKFANAEPRDIVLMGSNELWTTKIDRALGVIIIQRYPLHGEGPLVNINVTYSGMVDDSNGSKRALKLEYQLTNGNIHGLGATLYPNEIAGYYKEHYHYLLLEAPELGFKNSGVLTQAMVNKVLASKGILGSSLPAIRAYDSGSTGGDVVFNDYPNRPSELGLDITSVRNEVVLSQAGIPGWEITVPRNIKI